MTDNNQRVNEQAGKFRKKPVVIDAVQWPGQKFETTPPKWFTDAMYLEPGSPGFVMRLGDTIRISTLEGEVTAQPGDWIIYGVKGELYPCKPDIFEATYEPASPDEQAAPEAPAAASDLPRWIDNQKGSDPMTDDLIAYIEELRAALALAQQTPAAASGEQMFNDWRATQPDPHNIPEWLGADKWVRAYWDKLAAYGEARALAQQSTRGKP